MNIILDIVGSSLVAGFILLVVANFNSRFADFSEEFISTQSAQSEISNVSEIIEHDLYKIGYKVTTDKILNAKGTQLTYLTDNLDDGKIDTIDYYYLSAQNYLSVAEQKISTDKILFRKVNLDSASTLSRIKDLLFVYYDSAGTVLTYADLLNGASERNKIKSIGVSIEIAFTELTDTSNNHVSKFNERIYPRNL